MLGLTFSSKLDWGFYIISIAKNPYKKIKAFIRSITFLSLEGLYVSLWISMNLKYTHVWNAIVTSGLVLLVATWNC